jgi:hypothetical protein
LPGTNTLAYYKNPSIMVIKSFVGLAPGAMDIFEEKTYKSKPWR